MMVNVHWYILHLAARWYTNRWKSPIFQIACQNITRSLIQHVQQWMKTQYIYMSYPVSLGLFAVTIRANFWKYADGENF